MRNDLGLELDERDYAKNPFSESELKQLFAEAGLDPRDLLSVKSPTYKKMGLADKKLTSAEAIRLMAREPNLLKRPIVIAGKTVIAGFDKERLRTALS